MDSTTCSVLKDTPDLAKNKSIEYDKKRSIELIEYDLQRFFIKYSALKVILIKTVNLNKNVSVFKNCDFRKKNVRPWLFSKIKF